MSEQWTTEVSQRRARQPTPRSRRGRRPRRRRGRRRRATPPTRGRRRGRRRPTSAATDDGRGAVPRPRPRADGRGRRRGRPTARTRRPTRSRSSRRELRLQPGDWYVVHSYAGYENRVKTNLETRIQSSTWRTTSSRSRSRWRRSPRSRTASASRSSRKVLPGYILVRMDLTDESWGAVRNTPGVTGFVGHAHQPVAAAARRGLHDARPELAAGEAGAGEPPADGRPDVRVVDFEVGESVTVMDGPFATLPGHDHRDQRRHPEAQGAGLDLRPGDPGRAVVQPGHQDLSQRTSRRPAPPARRPRQKDPNMPPKKKKVSGCHQAADPGRRGHPGPAGRPRARPARRQHHGVLQGVQRRDRVAARQRHPGRDHGLRGPLVHLRHQDARRPPS